MLASSFRLGRTAADVQLAIGIAVNDVWEVRTGRRQDLTVQVPQAAAALKSYTYLDLDRPEIKQQFVAQVGRQKISTPHPTKDGRYFLPHMGLPHLADRILTILGCDFELEAVQRAVAEWDALELEDAVAAASGCGAMVRSEAEWLAHPHGQLLASKAVIELEKIGDAPSQAFSADPARPLSGVRVLDLTRILAGPTCARTLAEHGADVLMVTAASLPQTSWFVLDTSHGKRTTFLDLKAPDERATLLALLADADVFSQGYRPGAMDKLGLSPEEMAAHRPGIIYTSMNCYGFDGPFADRAGWEQLAQTVTGIANEQGGDEPPRILPAAACDYLTGYLAAYGTLLAMHRRATEGGSWHVKASLCQSGMFLQRQGRVDYEQGIDIPTSVVDDIRLSTPTPYGQMTHLGPVLGMSETQPHWVHPSSPLGSHAPAWEVS